MIELRDLTVRFDGHEAVRHASFAAEAGDWVVLIGPNGAGKTSVLRAMCGLLPFEGEILVDGRDVRSLSRRELARIVAFVPQTPETPHELTVAEYVLLGRTPHIGYFAAEGSADRRAAASALDRLELSPFAERPLGSLSGGELQRVVLARALAQEAPILLLDEPTTRARPRPPAAGARADRLAAHRRPDRRLDDARPDARGAVRRAVAPARPRRRSSPKGRPRRCSRSRTSRRTTTRACGSCRTRTGSSSCRCADDARAPDRRRAERQVEPRRRAGRARGRAGRVRRHRRGGRRRDGRAHRAAPAGAAADWTTVEEPVELARAVAAAPGDAVLVVDCLSLWVANVLERGGRSRPRRRTPRLAAARPGPTIAVTNEVGLGIVPATSSRGATATRSAG